MFYFVFMQTHGNIVALAIDKTAGKIFWANNGWQYKALYKVDLNGDYYPESIITGG